jgi:hypothetical protein
MGSPPDVPLHTFYPHLPRFIACLTLPPYAFETAKIVVRLNKEQAVFTTRAAPSLNLIRQMDGYKNPFGLALG